MSNENKLSTAPAGAVAQKTAGGGALSVFADGASFNTALRMAQCLASSTVVPKEYHGNVGNCMIAIEMASRINTSPMMVMQNLYIVNGRPAWSSQWIIAMINSSRRYKTELQFEFGRDKADGGLSCRAWAEDYSGHKVYGPMGIGVLYGREELLNAMPPFLTGGEMIESVTRDGAVFAELPHKFEAGTVNAADAVGLHAAIDYVKSIGFTAMHQQEVALTRRAMDAIGEMPHVHVLGSEKPEEHCGIITFTVDGVHPHDISEILASDGVAIRAGHHCAQPLLAYLKHPSTARASLAFYNTESEVDRLLDSISTLRERMGYGK